MGDDQDKTTDGEVTPVTPEGAVAEKKRRGLPSGFTTLRDAICFVFGAVIVINEVFVSKRVEPYAIGVGVALMGLPLVFGADERKPK